MKKGLNDPILRGLKMHSKESLIADILGNNKGEGESFKNGPREGQREGFFDGMKGGSLKVTVETETVQVPAGGLAPKQRKGMETVKGTRAKKKRSRLTNGKFGEEWVIYKCKRAKYHL